MRKYKQSILVVCLNENSGKAVAEKLAENLSMLFASCRELVEYEVFDTKAIIEKCGIEYYQKKEKGSLKHISKFENAVIFVDYEYFVKGYDYFSNNCNFVFIKVRKSQLVEDDTINSISFKERTEEVEKRCEYVVTLKSTIEKTVKDVIKQFRSEQ